MRAATEDRFEQGLILVVGSFYQGPSGAQNLNAISVRNFDPQNNAFTSWTTGNGYRVQYTDNQIASVSGTRAHVKLDAKHLIRQYSNQLCQGGGVRGPIYMRAIQLVMKGTGTNMSVEITNVTANAFKYAPGTFTSSSVTPGTYTYKYLCMEYGMN